MPPPPPFGLLSLPDDRSPEEPAAPYDGIALVSNGAVKETRPSINPSIAVSYPSSDAGDASKVLTGQSKPSSFFGTEIS